MHGTSLGYSMFRESESPRAPGARHTEGAQRGSSRNRFPTIRESRNSEYEYIYRVARVAYAPRGMARRETAGE